jgi:carboxylate-amine ligase
MMAARDTPTDLHALFDAPAPLTIGVEEEVMLLDARTLDLAPRAEEVLAALGGDPRFKRELPARSWRSRSRPSRRPGEAARRWPRRGGGSPMRSAASCAGGRRGAPVRVPAGRAADRAALRGVRRGVSGTSRACSWSSRCRSTSRCAVPTGRSRSTTRCAASCRSSPRWRPTGRSTRGATAGLASVRPKLADLLPRQGVPPAIASWEAHAAVLARLPDPAQWWFELRPHPVHGTLELRVPDAQATVADSAAVIAVARPAPPCSSSASTRGDARGR